MTVEAVVLSPGDALLVVDVQQDFLPGGRLAVPRGDDVVAPMNRYLRAFKARALPVYATRDWHPANHCSFQAQGGPWPPHCVAGTAGAAIPPELELPADATIVSKATEPGAEAYSAFEGTDLAARLQASAVTRLFIGGLATDYCVLATAKDALRLGFATYLLGDAVRAVNRSPGDGQEAIESMLTAGTRTIRYQDLDTH